MRAMIAYRLAMISSDRLREAKRGSRSSGPNVHYPVDSGEYILNTVDLISHRSGVIQNTSRPAMPKHLAVRRIQREQIAGSIRRKKQMSCRRQYTCTRYSFLVLSRERRLNQVWPDTAQRFPSVTH